MRKLDDLLRARSRVGNGKEGPDLQPGAWASLLRSQEFCFLAKSFEASHGDDPYAAMDAKYEAMRDGMNSVAHGQTEMSRELMLDLLDESGASVGPMTPDDYDWSRREWEAWTRFAKPEWIDILLDILANPPEWMPHSPSQVSTDNFAVWADFESLFWDVAEAFPQIALDKLQPLLDHPNELKRRIARELAEDIQEDVAHAMRLNNAEMATDKGPQAAG